MKWGAPVVAYLFAASAVLAGNYSLEPLAIDTAGGTGTSSNYGLTASSTPGGHGASVTYTARTGFAGQLGGIVGIALSAPAASFAETGSMQFSAEMIYDDGSRFPLSSDGVAWSASGSIGKISATGLATAGAVYEDTPATVRGASGPYAAEIEVSILDVLGDNFGSYAIDGLPDAWQVRYFGVAAEDAGKYDDFDKDGVSNLIEFASGTDPAGGGRQTLQFADGVFTAPGLPAIDFSPTTNALSQRALFVRRKDSNIIYRAQFSRNLSTWSNATTPLEILADDGEFELVGVRFPVLIGGLRSGTKFFRLDLTSQSP